MANGSREFRLWYAILIGVISLVILMVSGASYGQWRDHQQDQRWCDLLVSLDQPISPKASQRSKDILAKIHKLRVDFKC